jgi:hypothetical protein
MDPARQQQWHPPHVTKYFCAAADAPEVGVGSVSHVFKWCGQDVALRDEELTSQLRLCLRNLAWTKRVHRPSIVRKASTPCCTKSLKMFCR